MRNPAPIIATLMLGALIAFLLIRQEKPTPPQPQPPAPPAPSRPSPALSFLAEPPDWTALDAFQHTITRSDFERLLTQIFTTDETWRQYITFNEGSAEILTTTDPAEPPFSLHFATSEKKLPAPRTWQPTRTLPVAQPGKPLANLHIAIDPGHIGGDWAKIEERWFKIGDDKPVTEGDMTLRVAKLLQPLLEAMGAQVTLVRSTTEPV
ncbi:MAG: N-acetylmuramoyl-L-alanine amidase, partial [Luteolibacter sp.]